MAASLGRIEVHLYSGTQGDVMTFFDYDGADKATRKWHEALVEHAKRTWQKAGKTGTVQSLPYVGVRWKKGQIPPALWGDDTSKLKDGDIIPSGTREFKLMVREASGAIKVPPTVDALLNTYFAAGVEKLVVFIFVP